MNTDHMRSELTLDDFEGTTREAAEAGPDVVVFTQKFVAFMQQAYPKIGISEGQIAPMNSLLEEIVLDIRRTSEDPRQAFYQCCSDDERDTETRADMIIAWRLDLQYPSNLSLTLPYVEHPLRAIILKEKPTSTKALRRLITCPMKPLARVEMYDNHFDIVETVQSTEGTFLVRNPFEYAGTFEKYHIYANNPQHNTFQETLASRVRNLPFW